MYFILPQNVDGGGAVSSSLCFLYSSTICPGTAFSLKWRPMFLKPSVLSSHHDCCHSRLIPGSCLKMARQTARYCISFPSAIIFAKRRYSSLWLSFHWRMSALNCSYVCFCPSIFILYYYRLISKDKWKRETVSLIGSPVPSSSRRQSCGTVRRPGSLPNVPTWRLSGSGP